MIKQQKEEDFQGSRELQKAKKYQKWNNCQKQLYLKSLFILRHELVSQYSRRSEKVFVRMSEIVKSRSSTQCRTHHQKMMFKYRSMEQIMLGLQKKPKSRRKQIVESTQKQQERSKTENKEIKIEEGFSCENSGREEKVSKSWKKCEMPTVKMEEDSYLNQRNIGIYGYAFDMIQQMQFPDLQL